MDDEHHRGHETPGEGPRYSRGEEKSGPSEEKERVGDFAQGQEEPEHDHQHSGRFSEGQELEPEDREKEHRGDFAVGQEDEE